MPAEPNPDHVVSSGDSFSDYLIDRLDVPIVPLLDSHALARLLDHFTHGPTNSEAAARVAIDWFLRQRLAVAHLTGELPAPCRICDELRFQRDAYKRDADVYHDLADQMEDRFEAMREQYDDEHDAHDAAEVEILELREALFNLRLRFAGLEGSDG